MLNVLLVDDEPWVLEGLRTMVNWDKYGFRICGEAANGNAAWSLIEQLQPDLVFTDIHMPSVSGLELINRSLHGLARPPQFVILSGYDNFEYAKTALEQRVEDYLLKPIDEIEVEAVLEQMRLKIREGQASEELHRRERSLYINCLINRLLQGEESAELEREVADVLHIEDDDGNLSCLLIETEGGEEEIKLLMRHLADSDFDAPVLFTDFEGRVGCFISETVCTLERFEIQVRKISGIHSQKPSLMVASGHSFGGVQAVRSAYERALAALEWKRYQDGAGVVHYQELPQNHGIKNVNQQALATLMEMVCSGDQGEVEVAVEALLANPSLGQMISDMEYVRIQLLALEMGILKKLNELGGDVAGFMQIVQYKWGNLLRISSYAELRQYAIILSLHASTALRKQQVRSEGDTIFQVVQYVNQEFREKLQLRELAQQFHMNSNYLGQVFKQQTGKSFREYLNDKRIEEAKRLLRHSRLSIADVAENSGYPNADYFVCQFKRMTGMAPSAYRKQQ